ncbi:MAG TPA: hypothetical protein VJ866_02550 [Pyrinomonadaceae bacterium]|nr:hypothetical protein [Pyrinomonadaceae bacterium]
MATTPRDDIMRQSGRRKINVVQGEPIVAALRRAARSALLEHKRVGNPVASSEDGKVVIIPAEEIEVEETPADADGD